MTAATALCAAHPERCQLDGLPVVVLAVALVALTLLTIWMVARR